MATTWLKINSTEKQKKDEIEIIDFLSKCSFRDRYSIIGYLFKLQSAGLYIPSIRSLMNYCEESIVVLQIDEENKYGSAVHQEEKGYPVWSWLDDSKPQPKKSKNAQVKNWCNYEYPTNRKIECACRNQFRFVKVDDIHFIDLKEMIQIRYNDKSRSRPIKRSTGKNTNLIEKVVNNNNDADDNKVIEPTTITTTTTTIETTPDKNINNNEKEEIIKWYWIDDGFGILGGIKSKWVEYDSELCKKIENEYQRKSNGEPVKIDHIRFVDTTKMLQIRYDSKKGRAIKREVVTPKSSSSSVPSPTKIITDLFNNISIGSSNNSSNNTKKQVKLKDTPSTLSLVLTLNQLVRLLSILRNSSTLKSTEQQTPATKFVLEKYKKSLIKSNNRILHTKIK